MSPLQAPFQQLIIEMLLLGLCFLSLVLLGFCNSKYVHYLVHDTTTSKHAAQEVLSLESRLLIACRMQKL